MADQPFQIHGVHGSIDKHGIVSVDVPFWAPDIVGALYGLPDLDFQIGIPLVSRSFRQSEEGGYEVTAHFEGIDAEYKPADKVTFELDMSMSEDPIGTHPNFEALKNKYGWIKDEEKFPEFMPADGGDSALPGQKPPQKKSPLYKVESYLAVGAIYRKSFASLTIPDDIFFGIGAIDKNPPGIENFPLPPAAKKRQWLKLAPKVQLKGNAIQITQEWQLSGPSGVNTDIYGAAQLGDKDTSGGTGSGTNGGS